MQGSTLKLAPLAGTSGFRLGIQGSVGGSAAHRIPAPHLGAGTGPGRPRPHSEIGEIASCTIRRTHAATVRRVNTPKTMMAACHLSRGGSIEISGTPQSGYLLAAASEGAAEISNTDGISCLRHEHLELRPSNKNVTITSKLGAGVALLWVSHDVLVNRVRESQERRPVPFPPHVLRMEADHRSLATRLLRDGLIRAAECVKEGSDAQAKRAVEVVLSLLLEAIADTPVVPEFSSEPATPWYVLMIERFISENSGREVRVRDLARMAGISPRTVHEGFRRFRGYSPMKYLRDQRMTLVRRELTDSRSVTTVTDAALKWGFNHLGRFSAYYTQQFGEKPSDTLRLSRTPFRSRETSTASYV